MFTFCTCDVIIRSHGTIWTRKLKFRGIFASGDQLLFTELINIIKYGVISSVLLEHDSRMSISLFRDWYGPYAL